MIFAFISRQKAEAFLKICSLTYRTFANFLAGQCLEAIILGSMFVVTLSILKMPYALLIGILIAFTALIPIFGAFIGCAVGVFLIFMVSPKQAVLFIIILKLRTCFLPMHLENSIPGSYSVVKVPLLCCLKL